MSRSCIVLLTALLSAAPFAAAEDCAPKSPVAITVTRSDGGALATYQFDEAVSCLGLNDRGDVRKLSWQLQTPGAALSEDGNTVRFAAPRKDFAVRLRAFEHDGAIDRAYSPLIAFGDQSSVAVYTSYLYPAVHDRGVWIAFDGFAPTASQRPVGQQRIGFVQTYILVGKPLVERRGQVAAVIDRALPASLLRKVNSAIAQGEAALNKISPASRALTYLVTYTEPGTAIANWRGDTLDNLVRLNFMGAPWQESRADHDESLTHFILHELFHTAITSALNPRLPGAMTLSEGGAEAGAMAMRGRFTGSAPAGMHAAIDKAIARCQDLDGMTLADKEQKSQRAAPYACGAALQFMVASATQRDPLDIWKTLLQQAKPLDAGWPAFLDAAAYDGKPNKNALAILREMTASRIDWAGGIAQLAGIGLLRRQTEAELALPVNADRYRQAALFHLLEQACSRTRYGFNTESSVYILDAPAGQCGAIPDQFRLVALNGIQLGRDASQAYHELARRCAARLPIQLADDQGRTRDVTCKTPPKDVVMYTLSPAGG